MPASALWRQLEPLLAAAAMAPSSHNCQPWHLRIGADDALTIGIDHRRSLRALPALEREMGLSAGAFTALLFNLLRLSGWQAKASMLADCARAGAVEPLVRIELGGCIAPADPLALPRLLEAIRRRRTVRSPYDRHTPLRFDPSRRFLAHRLEDGDDAPLHWTCLAPGEPLDRLADFHARHASRDRLDRDAWRETYRHLVFGGAPATLPSVGMPLPCLFGPMPAWRRRWQQAALHPRLSWLARRAGWVDGFAARIAALVRDSAGVLVLRAPSDTTRALQVLAGERMVDLWLLAGHCGQALHPLSVGLQHPDLAAELAHSHGWQDTPIFLARAGTPQGLPQPCPMLRLAPMHFTTSDTPLTSEAS